MPINIPVLGELSLSTEATIGFIKFTLPGLIEEGLSGAKSLQLYRDNGYHIATSTFYDIRREILGIEKDAHTIKYVNPDYMPDSDKFAVANWDLESDYFFVASYTEYDLDSDTLSTRYYSMQTNELNTPSVLEAEMMDLLSQQYPQENLFRANMRLEKAFRSG